VSLSTQHFVAMQNVGQIKSFVDDLITKRGTVSTRVAFVLRSVEVHPMFRGLCNLPKKQDMLFFWCLPNAPPIYLHFTFLQSLCLPPKNKIPQPFLFFRLQQSTIFINPAGNTKMIPTISTPLLANNQPHSMHPAPHSSSSDCHSFSGSTPTNPFIFQVQPPPSFFRECFAFFCARSFSTASIPGKPALFIIQGASLTPTCSFFPSPPCCPFFFRVGSVHSTINQFCFATKTLLFLAFPHPTQQFSFFSPR
jgi:hypothetical protein